VHGRLWKSERRLDTTNKCSVVVVIVPLQIQQQFGWCYMTVRVALVGWQLDTAEYFHLFFTERFVGCAHFARRVALDSRFVIFPNTNPLFLFDLERVNGKH
jgi:hypothetical protein